jgi:hypothetical protein
MVEKGEPATGVSVPSEAALKAQTSVVLVFALLGRFHFQALGLVPGEDEQFRLLRIRSSRPPLNLQWRRVTAAKEGGCFTFVAGIKRSDCRISNIHLSTTIRMGRVVGIWLWEKRSQMEIAGSAIEIRARGRY